MHSKCLFSKHRAQKKAPETRWLAIVGHWGVLEICVFLRVPIFFLFISFNVQCTGCQGLCVSASRRLPRTVLGGSGSRTVHCCTKSEAHMRIDVNCMLLIDVVIFLL